MMKSLIFFISFFFFSSYTSFAQAKPEQPNIILIHNQWESYNLSEDPTELNDLAQKNPEKKSRLEKLYADWTIKNGVLPWSVVNRI
ncbi:MAG TPA: hypothetical protein VNI52_10625 [Sphingobacteriaceae bacterium]|nr:hypothetical protein [Sphingobacteriaceae bacterium]